MNMKFTNKKEVTFGIGFSSTISREATKQFIKVLIHYTYWNNSLSKGQHSLLHETQIHFAINNNYTSQVDFKNGCVFDRINYLTATPGKNRFLPGVAVKLFC
jgi:hypothetical protein